MERDSEKNLLPAQTEGREQSTREAGEDAAQGCPQGVRKGKTSPSPGQSAQGGAPLHPAWGGAGEEHRQQGTGSSRG